ncbi:MAG: cysteine desulfurase family protein [Thermodesulfobacteriota bacterium]
MKKVYLDYNATTPIDPRVIEEMLPYLSEHHGNPSSIHSYGRQAKKGLDDSREQVAQLLNCSAKEVMFTSGGSEGANFAIKSAALGSLKEKGNHIITTKVEHECVLESFHYLEKQGYETTYLDVNSDGQIDIDELRDSISDKTILVSCIYANNETGVISPIEEIASIVKEQGIAFHTDAVQAAGKLPIDVEKIPADFLSISAHKYYGPKAVGVLYIRDDFSQKVTLPAQIHGGGQERGKRSGTENIAGIVGLGYASNLACREMSSDQSKIGELRNKLLNEISANIKGVKINGSMDKILWNTLNISIEGVRGDSLAMNLDIEGVAVSTGSACSEGAIDPSHVLAAMGLSKKDASSSIRLSLGRFTSLEDIDYVASVMPKVVDRIRSVS